MTLTFKAPENVVLKPIITVIGVGGAGGNAVNNMIAANLQGANFLVANTDAQALQNSLCDRRIQLGANKTRGLGAGANPEVGAEAADESADEIRSFLEGSHMVFITAGMGGGTGTGSGPVIAKIARELGILTVGVVTKPFHFEGAYRMRTAEEGVKKLQECVDTLIIIPNQNLFYIANERTTFTEAFELADKVLHAGVRSVTDLMIMPGLINLDFADIKTIMSEMGKAMMGTGEASGEDRAVKAAQAAIANPLLDHNSMKGAKGVLINITGGEDMTLFEVDNAANEIRKEVGNSEANIIFGSTFNPDFKGILRVSVVATGIDADQTSSLSSNLTQKSSELDTGAYDTQNSEGDLAVAASMLENGNNSEQFEDNTLDAEEAVDQMAALYEQHQQVMEASRLPTRPVENNPRVAWLTKMWKSLNKSSDKQTNLSNPREEYSNIQPQYKQKATKVGGESDVHDIPAFLRKK